jgi:hypothetical protein
MCDFKIPRSKSVEVVCGIANGINQMKQDTDLSSAKIVGIAAFKVGDVAVGPQTATALQADAAFSKSFLTLKSGSDEIIQQMPLSQLCPQANGGRIRQFNIPNVDWSKCYITCSAGDDAKIWVLDVYYILDNK